MFQRPYFSVRLARHSGDTVIDLNALSKLLVAMFHDFESRYYFQEATGYECVDSGFVYGTMGPNPEAYALTRLKKPGLWPIRDDVEYRENDIFDIIEFLYDHVSEPVYGRYHDYGNCGWHYDIFDKQAGRQKFRMVVNDTLKDYPGNWVLSEQGYLKFAGDKGLEPLLEANLADGADKKVSSRVDNAIRMFCGRNATIDDKRNAVRDLVDVLEFLRPQAKKRLTRTDEKDLFNIANNFGIRHYTCEQKTNYRQEIRLPWMFYYYLATIHALTRLIDDTD